MITLPIAVKKPIKIKTDKMFAEVEGSVELILEHDTAEQLFLALSVALHVPKEKPPEVI